MATAALRKEESYGEQLAGAQSVARQQRRMGQVLEFPTGRPLPAQAAAAREAELPSGERFQSEQTRRAQEANATRLPELNLLAEQGLLSQTALEQAKAESQQIAARLQAATTIAELSAVRAQANAFKEKFAGIEIGEKEREIIDEYREQFWRGLRIGGPAVDDATVAMTFGLGTLISYVIWIVQALKGIRYRNEPEPLTVIAILSPPPMSLSVAKKDIAKLGKIVVVTLIDVMGFMWNNVNAAIVVMLAALLIIIIIAVNCAINPITISQFPELCSSFASLFTSVLP